MNQDPNNTAFIAGAIFGATIVGILCGLIPLAVGRNRGRPGIGWVGFGLCVVSGFLLGLLGAVPMAGVMSLVVLVAGRPAGESERREPRSTPKATAPEPYDL